MTAIRQVLSGRVYLSELMHNRLLYKVVGGVSAALASDLGQLSDRELEVFQLIGEGRSTRQIGDSLHLSVSTVETYRAHLKQKLGLANATELVQRAVQWVHTRNS
jgi:DNA-binding NarL/FixJ family response regulator